METLLIQKYLSKWWVLILTALMHGFLTPPWNHERHWLLFFTPFISTLGLFAFYQIAYTKSKLWVKVLRYWLYGICSVGAGSYWILDVEVEGMPYLMYQALIALALFFGLWFVPVGMSLSLLKKYRPRLLLIAFPATWVLWDYLRTLGELSFPWHFEGYTYIHFPAFAQLSSVTGIWGVSFLVVLGSFTLYLLLCEGKKWLRYVLFEIGVVAIVIIAGAISLHLHRDSERQARFALIQSNMDQENWDGFVSLDSALTISDSMIGSVVSDSVDYAILPESGVFCYLSRTPKVRKKVQSWAVKYDMSIVTGTLHKEVDSTGEKVYNSCFYLPRGCREFEHYYKQKLVPFGESMPFQGLFPLINRLDLGGGHFSQGRGNCLWQLGDSIATAPIICYEAIYPSYIHRRTRNAAMILNVTNDGWFGDGSGPYQHRTISRTRAIETGLPLVRVANSGISFAVDHVGRYIKETSLGTREAVTVEVPLETHMTLYRLWGDWFLSLMVIILILSLFFRSSPVTKSIH